MPENSRLEFPDHNPNRPVETPGSHIPAPLPAMDRRTAPDRRTPDRQSGDTGQRRRSSDSPTADAGAEQDYSGLERRRGPGRRLSDMRKSAEQGEMTKEQFLFLMAIDSFKKANDLAFPTWTDVLEVVRLLGYRKVRKSELNLQNAEDWSESFDAPSNVRPERWRAWKRIDRDRTDRKAA